MRNRKRALLLVQTLITLPMIGCSLMERFGVNTGTTSTPQSTPQGPFGRMSRNQGTYDVGPLVRARLALPAPPTSPRPPRLEPEDADRIANRDATVRTAFRGAFDRRDAELVTVIGRESLVGMSSAAGQFVSDLLFAELQKREVRLADRDYRIMKSAEFEDIVTGDLINLTPKQREQIQQGEQAAISYYIVVHAVNVPNNPITVQIPWHVPAEEWEAYVQRRDQFMEDVKSYNEAVRAYNEKLRDAAGRIGPATHLVDGPKSLQASVDGVTRLAMFIEATPEVAEKRGEERRQVAELRGAGPEPAAMSTRGTPRSPSQIPTMVFNLASHQMARPLPIDADSAPIFQSPEEVVAGRDVSYVGQVQAFQGAVSVRVIDLKTSQPIWFGLATSQDRSYTEAIAKSCAALADAMLYSPETGGKSRG